MPKFLCYLEDGNKVELELPKAPTSAGEIHVMSQAHMVAVIRVDLIPEPPPAPEAATPAEATPAEATSTETTAPATPPV
jgi:hypothetical protein